MKLLVFAHTPPPHHGQSFMVQVMLDGLKAEDSGAINRPTIECFHVNARYSRDLEDVGGFRFEKLWLVFRYSAQALRHRFKHGVKTLYYIPAPARKTPLFRDWIALLICRPFFSRVIFHWHAVGLGEWSQTKAGRLTSWLTRRLLGNADLSIVLSKFNEADAARLNPRRIEVVSNGIPDPCPHFHTTLLQRRRQRRAERQRLLDTPAAAAQSTDPTAEPINVLFLAHCTREKGLFDALEAVALANETLRRKNSKGRFRLTVAGNFVTEDERATFFERVKLLDGATHCEHVGFVSGSTKTKRLEEAEIFLFPTFYANEGQPVNLIEAMAFGLPIVTTRWRSIPEFLPGDYPGLVATHDVPALAQALLAVAPAEDGERFRLIYEREFSVQQHIAKLANALASVPS